MLLYFEKCGCPTSCNMIAVLLQLAVRVCNCNISLVSEICSHFFFRTSCLIDASDMLICLFVLIIWKLLASGMKFHLMLRKQRIKFSRYKFKSVKKDKYCLTHYVHSSAKPLWGDANSFLKVNFKLCQHLYNRVFLEVVTFVEVFCLLNLFFL